MIKRIVIFLLLFAGVYNVFAAPVNDDCSGAITLTSSTTGFNFVSGTTAGATQSLAACSGTANDDVWYTFTATSAEHTITVKPSTSFDPTFQLFDVCGGTSLGCINVNGPGAYETKNFTGLTIGTTYVLRVYDWNLAAYEGTKTFDIALETGNTIAAIPGTAWVWKSGGNGTNSAGTFGTKGIPSATNAPPSKSGGARWIQGGNLWLFGGFGDAGYYNDLWKYDTAAATWTWVSGTNTTADRGSYGTVGVPSTSNYPGARANAVSWTANDGNFWFYGGEGYKATSTGSGYQSDVWRYNPSTNEWTWMFGNTQYYPTFGTTGTPSASVTPGGREGASSWVDAQGNFWLFGGLGYINSTTSNDSYSNDLWKYDIVTNQWTHIKGSKAANSLGVYGTKGVATSSTIPAGRSNGHTWIDNNGDLWLYGGETNFLAFIGDVWKYNIAANEWTWMGGTSTTGVGAPYYGIKGQESASVSPGYRRYGMPFKDKEGKLWFVGGHKMTSPTSGVTPYMDLFILNPATGNFTWMGGAGDCCTSVNYGTLNTASPSNTPGARASSLTWSDGNGNFWLFGGFNNLNYRNDLWQFKTASFSAPSAPASITTDWSLPVCPDHKVVLTANGGSGTIKWYDAPTGGNYLGSGTTFTTPLLYADTKYYAESNTWMASATRKEINVTIIPPPVITITGTTTICEGQSTTLTASGADYYVWTGGPSIPPYTVNPTTTTTYTVRGVSSATNCIGSASQEVTVNTVETVSLIAAANTACDNDPLITLTGSPAGGTYSGIAVTGSSFDPSTAGIGTYTITYNYNTCSSATTDIVVQTCTGIVNADAGLETIYPNPATDYFIVNCNEPSMLKLSRVNGQVVLQKNISQGETSVALNTLSAGIYVVEIQNTEGTKQGRLVVTK